VFVPPILGRHHETVKRLRTLRRDAASRRREGVFVAEGIHLVDEALGARVDVEMFVASPKLHATDEGRALSRRIDETGSSRFEVADAVLESLQDARSPQPVLALVRRPAPAIDETLAPSAGEPAMVLVIHGVQDPGNLGALLRTADAAGAAAAFVCGGGADPYHPRAVRASMGSVFRLPPVEASADAILESIGSAGLVTVGTDASGGPAYHELDLRRPMALVLGGEGRGLPAELAASLDETAHIPMRAGVESLSVAAAAAVILFEAARQRAAD
jgi:TrmH family RNA methyltransferase